MRGGVSCLVRVLSRVPVSAQVGIRTSCLPLASPSRAGLGEAHVRCTHAILRLALALARPSRPGRQVPQGILGSSRPHELVQDLSWLKVNHNNKLAAGPVGSWRHMFSIIPKSIRTAIFLHEGLPLPKCSYNLWGRARASVCRINSRETWDQLDISLTASSWSPPDASLAP